MQLSLGLITRWTIYAAVSACGMAAFFGCWAGPDFEARIGIDAPIVALNIAGADGVPRPHSFDRLTGRLESLMIDPDDRLEFPSAAPWADAFGRSQIVGRWTRRDGAGTNSLGAAFGLARFTLPEGKPIDRIDTEIVPAAAPCWLPSHDVAIVFPAADGRLYRFAFESNEPGDDTSGPTAVEWAAESPKDETVAIGEITRASEGALPGILIASVRLRGGDRSDLDFSRPQLWWLRMDSAYRRVVDAGPILGDLGADTAAVRFPTVARDANNRLRIAYLASIDGRAGWTAIVNRLNYDPKLGHPTAEPAQARAVLENCALAPPCFLADGQTLSAFAAPSEPRAGTLKSVRARLPE